MIVANFLAGVLVGALLGLAVAPVLRAWITWRTVEDARRQHERARDDERAFIER